MRRLVIILFLFFSFLGCGRGSNDVAEIVKAGQDLFLSGDYRGARAKLDEGLKISPSDHDLLYYMGMAYNRDYMYDSALFYLKKVDLLYPDEREINIAIYQVAPLAGDWKNSITAARNLIDLGEAPEKYWNDLAEFNRQLNQNRNAHYYYRKLLEREPDNIDRYLQVANTAASLDLVEEARNVIDSAIDRFGPSDILLGNQATILSFAGKHQQAEDIFRSLLAKDTASVYIKLNLASCLSSQNNTAKKREALSLLTDVRAATEDQPQLDTMIATLKTELNITD
jgi:tetratricopeptide (TPR) repeat protein